jgi:integrase
MEKQPVTDVAERVRAEPNAKVLTDLAIGRLKPRDRQFYVWDRSQRGLGVLISPSGVRSFVSQYKFNGKWVRRNLGRFGEVAEDDGGEDHNLAWARARVREDRRLAKEGIDPQAVAPKTSKVVFEAVVDDFIRLYAQPNQRSWEHTERTLKKTCKAWLAKPIVDITKRDAQDLIDGLVVGGQGPKAARTLATLRKFWRWAWKRDIVPTPLMDAVEAHYEKNERDRVYSDDEIKLIWSAAEDLSPVECAYFKVLLLLAPRKTALAQMQRGHVKDDISHWTTPFELVKAKKSATTKRRYETPLPLLAQRILKPLLKGLEPTDWVFPGRGGTALSVSGQPLRNKLIKAGAPKDFNYHACRHTVATWLENQGHDEFDRGLILNHSSSSVTAGYSHGFAVDRKLALLQKWSDHVEGLVTAKGVALLR